MQYYTDPREGTTANVDVSCMVASTEAVGCGPIELTVKMNIRNNQQ